MVCDNCGKLIELKDGRFSTRTDVLDKYWAHSLSGSVFCQLGSPGSTIAEPSTDTTA